MLSRDYRDVVGGLLLIAVGVAFLLYSLGHYEVGTVRRMGPGMFPAALGVVMVLLGAMLLVPALLRPGVLPHIRVRTPFFVLAGVAAFAVAIRPLGLIPAILAVTVVSSFAETRVRLLSLLGLCVSLSVMAWLTFSVGLGLPIPVFRWPF